MASTTLTTRAGAYSIKYRTCSLLYMTLFFLENNYFFSLLHIPQLSYDFSVCVCLWRYGGWSSLCQSTLWLNQCVSLNANMDGFALKLHTVSISLSNFNCISTSVAIYRQNNSFYLVHFPKSLFLNMNEETYQNV